MRGTAPRMKDNGRGLNPDGDLALGSYQSDAFGSHTHTQNAHNHVRNTDSITELTNVFPAAGNSGISSGYAGGNQTRQFLNTAQSTATNQNSGGNETRAKSTTVNYFIKIGY